MPGKHSTPTSVAPDPPQPTVVRVRGLVQHVLRERSYGFVRALDGEDAGSDFFFHAPSCLLDCTLDQLTEGSVVVFEPRKVAKGKRAERISRVEDLR